MPSKRTKRTLDCVPPLSTLQIQYVPTTPKDVDMKIYSYGKVVGKTGAEGVVKFGQYSHWVRSLSRCLGKGVRLNIVMRNHVRKRPPNTAW
jgi:hypothetical protein